MKACGYIFGDMSLLTQCPKIQKDNKCWTLIFVRKGNGIYLLGGELRALNEGDILFFPPKLDYSFASIDLGDEYNVNIDASVLRFDESWLDALLGVFHEMDDVILRIKEMRSAMFVSGLKWMSISTLMNESATCKDSARPQKIMSILDLVSDRKDMMPLTFSVNPEETVPVRLNKITRFIECNVYNKISLDEISAYAGMNRTYFCLFFKKHFGVGLTEYVNIKRIDLASGILLSTDDPVSSVAAQCGFTTVNYFNRIFRNIKGVTPGEYRNAHKNVRFVKNSAK